MEYKKYYGMIEAILFASGDPVSEDRLCEVTEIDRTTLSGLMAELSERYRDADRGIRIVKLNQSYQLCTKTEYESYIKRALEIKRNTPLSQAAMEVLAVIAYNEPVTKGFVEQVRGVDSSQTVNNLVEKGLVEEAGRLDVPGRPILYRTTEHFLRSFQMGSLKELPPLPDEGGQVMLSEYVSAEEKKQESE
jgi:segregation and condensation protein B